MLPYQSKLSITTMGPSCYLLLFKSENSKRVGLAQGAWMAMSVKCLTLDTNSSLELSIVSSSPVT